jgi:hypothetical protein
MEAYEFLDRPATCCIHFVTAREFDVCEVEREIIGGAGAPPSVTRRLVTLILRKVARKPEDIPNVAA